MSFVFPLRLLVLLVVPVALALALLLLRRPARHPVAFTNIAVLAAAAGKPAVHVRRWIPLGLLLLALTVAASAVAVPRLRIDVPKQNGTVVFLVDVSGSMRSSDIAPSRLEAAVNAMKTFVRHLPKSYRVGLVAFSSQPQVLQTPTTDRRRIFTALGYLEPEAATAIGDGLASAVQLTTSSLRAAGVKRQPGHKLPAAIVLESDGAQNMGTLSPTQGAELARRAGIPWTASRSARRTARCRSGSATSPTRSRSRPTRRWSSRSPTSRAARPTPPGARTGSAPSTRASARASGASTSGPA